jgi:hypothetical protein
MAPPTPPVHYGVAHDLGRQLCEVADQWPVQSRVRFLAEPQGDVLGAQ